MLAGLTRIAIIGCPGSGKTRLARSMSAATGLPHYCLDDFYWHPGWTRSTPEAWAQCIEQLISQDKWIIDGNYLESMRPRLRAAQAVIHLDLPRSACLLGVAQRLLVQIRNPSQALPQRIGESRRLIDRFYLDPKLLRLVWQFRRRTRPQMLAEIETLDPAIQVIVLASRNEMDAWMLRIGKT